MPVHIPDTKELLFDGLHEGLRKGVERGFDELVVKWPSVENALDIFTERLQVNVEVYLAACDVVTALVIPTRAATK